MAKKTWKIGEYAKGGIITAEVKGNSVTIIGLNQFNGKEFTRLTVNVENSNARRELDFFLIDLTTSYYTDKILEWIETKVKFKTSW